MNKSQQIAIMQIRAKQKVQELLERHELAWHGEEPEIIEDVEDTPKEED